ncbi:lactose-binding lectin l-2-like [Oncorhynchus keta]|uniref:lactose-binding lectin l-2-like n=1 Tax=Oncorhynchus keta TaxID=8018 RepID=UPI0015FE4150|nr:lactose-binding lectin l-2-like [Oncorhynchus keta]
MGASEPGQLHPKKMEGSTVRDWWHTQYRQLSHYLALLFSAECGHTPTDLLLLKDLTQKLNTLNNSYVLLFHKYPTLNLYSPVTTPSERECRPCPEGWDSFGERCCLYTQERQNWISGQYHCLSVGGNLAMVKSEEEQIFPWKRAKELSQGDSYWIGLKNGNPGGAGTGWTTPRWKKGFWDISWYHEPEKGDTRELCARLSQGDSHRAVWYATMCKNSLKTICEKTQGTLQ